MVLVCLQYVQSVLCIKCVSLYVHPSLFSVRGHSWEKCFPYLCLKKKKNLEKLFVNSGKNFQSPETRNISGDLHSTLVSNLWPSACCWRSDFCALVIFITLFLLSQTNRWTLRTLFFSWLANRRFEGGKNRINTGNQIGLWATNKGSLLRQS